MMGEDLVYWVWLSQCFSSGSGKIGKFLELSQDVKSLCLDGEQARRELSIFSEQDLKRMAKTSLDRAQMILEQCRELGIRVLSWADGEYPQRLREIYAPPAVLYVKGSLEGLDQELAITAVGTREAIGYTRGVTGNLCYQLARAGVTIISGCAMGIDEYAHRGALKAGGRTIAVLGCGLDVNYPAPNRELKEKILQFGGALVSELPPGTKPDGKYFPTRNRLLAGLGMGVLVTHAPERSGSLITADLAAEQGKEVFCVPPYNIYDSGCLGVVPLLQDGAKPVYSVHSILEEYYPLYSDRIDLKALSEELIQSKRAEVVREQRQKVADGAVYHAGRTTAEETAAVVKPPIELNSTQQKLYDALGDEPRPVDDIMNDAGLRSYQALASMTELELMGLAVAHPGRRYSRAH